LSATRRVSRIFAKKKKRFFAPIRARAPEARGSDERDNHDVVASIS
jgi:hypothetical protein